MTKSRLLRGVILGRTKLTHTLTGMTGVVTRISEYATGCVSVSVQFSTRTDEGRPSPWYSDIVQNWTIGKTSPVLLLNPSHIEGNATRSRLIPGVLMGSTKATSRYTGVKGMIVCVTEEMSGCTHISIQPDKLKEDGSELDWASFDLKAAKEDFGATSASKPSPPLPNPAKF